MFCIVPLQTYLYRSDRLKHGTNRPEARFLTSLVGVWGFPISLLWFAFTDDGYVHAPRLTHPPPVISWSLVTGVRGLFKQASGQPGPPVLLTRVCIGP